MRTHWIGGCEVNWSRIGLGLELSFGYWIPREWSAYLIIGPLLIYGGREEDYDA